jgi:hypothetical protein
MKRRITTLDQNQTQNGNQNQNQNQTQNGNQNQVNDYSYKEIISVYFSRAKDATELQRKIDIMTWAKIRIDFLFTIFMSSFLIFFFSGFISKRLYYEKINERETKLLFFLFGIILFIEAPWNTFIEQSPWLTFLQNIAG